MQTIAVFAVILFLLGLLLGLTVRQIRMRRHAAMAAEKEEATQKKTSPKPLDKTLSSG